MNMKFGQAMRRATALTRAGDIGGATRLIRAALTGGPDRSTDPMRLPKALAGPAPTLRAANSTAHIVDAEIISDAPGRDRKAKPGPRQSLGAAVAALHKGRRAVEAGRHLPRPRTQPDPLPINARFEHRRYSCAQGSRDYWLYIPASALEQPSGLIIMLHGCKQTPEDFACGTGMNTHAETHGFIVAYPSQTSASNMSSCWNWFQPGDQKRGSGEPAILAGITLVLMEKFQIPRDITFVAGLSAGGAMAVIMGKCYPDLFDATGVHSGLAYGSAKDVVSAFSAMLGQGGRLDAAGAGGPFVRTIVVHGTSDATVHQTNADAILADAKRAIVKGSTSWSENGRANGRSFARNTVLGPQGESLIEDWRISGAGHAWSGGDRAGSFADAAGPDASAAMVAFFFASRNGEKARR